jgi:hypothetical protein
MRPSAQLDIMKFSFTIYARSAPSRFHYANTIRSSAERRAGIAEPILRMVK